MQSNPGKWSKLPLLLLSSLAIFVVTTILFYLLIPIIKDYAIPLSLLVWVPMPLVIAPLALRLFPRPDRSRLKLILGVLACIVAPTLVFLGLLVIIKKANAWLDYFPTLLPFLAATVTGVMLLLLAGGILRLLPGLALPRKIISRFGLGTGLVGGYFAVAALVRYLPSDYDFFFLWLSVNLLQAWVTSLTAVLVFGQPDRINNLGDY